MKFLLLIFFPALCLTFWTRTAEEWRTRTLYQIVTDRFARTDDDTSECKNLMDYCGGTFKGIEKNLDYIQGMGFDAIWMSPVIENSPGGYHGYWYSNFYEINPHFGTKQDFIDLVKACHDRDIWVMVDVVPNHVTPVPNNTDFSSVYPFNDPKYYHFPILPCRDVFDNDPANQTAMEICWLWGLPDLNHENEFVAQTLLDWIRDFVQTYQVDGLRLDAVRHVPKWFLYEFSKAAGVFTVGEVWHPDVSYIAEYQGPIDSLLNFPLHSALDNAFRLSGSMLGISKYYQEATAQCSDISVLGNFVVNHDMQRYLHNNSDLPTYKALYSFVLCSIGIPAVYYGDEQSFTGGPDPENRENLWGKMDTNSEMYQYFKTIITFKKRTNFHQYEQRERVADDSFYAFSRGNYFFAFTNSMEPQVRTITSHPYAENTLLCNIFNEKECVEVKDGEFQVVIYDKQPKILFPQETAESGQAGATAWKNLKKIWNNVFTYDFAKLNPFGTSISKR